MDNESYSLSFVAILVPLSETGRKRDRKINRERERWREKERESTCVSVSPVCLYGKSNFEDVRVKYTISTYQEQLDTLMKKANDVIEHND